MVPTAIKVDHCELRYAQQANTSMLRIDRNTRNVSQCIADCIAVRPLLCKYVQVVRGTNPARTLSYTPNIPWVSLAHEQMRAQRVALSLRPC